MSKKIFPDNNLDEFPAQVIPQPPSSTAGIAAYVTLDSTMQRSVLVYLSVNAVAVALFLCGFYRVTAVLISEGRIASDAADGITFAAYAVPAVLVGFLANGIWGLGAIFDLCGRRDPDGMKWLAVGIAMWVGAVAGARAVKDLM